MELQRKIVSRYVDALHGMESVSTDAVEILLRLAITDAECAVPAAQDARIESLRADLATAINQRTDAECAVSEPAPDAVTLRRIEQLLENHDSYLYARVAEGNLRLDQAIQSILIAHHNERHSSGQQLIELNAANARLTQELAVVRSWSVTPNGNGDSTPNLTTNGVTLTWPGDLADWVEGLEKGRHDWRTLHRHVRWQLIANVVQQIPADQTAATNWFDLHRPAWMSTARAAAITFGQNRWQNVVERARTGEVAQ